MSGRNQGAHEVEVTQNLSQILQGKLYDHQTVQILFVDEAGGEGTNKWPPPALYTIKIKRLYAKEWNQCHWGCFCPHQTPCTATKNRRCKCWPWPERNDHTSNEVESSKQLGNAKANHRSHFVEEISIPDAALSRPGIHSRGRNGLQKTTRTLQNIEKQWQWPWQIVQYLKNVHVPRPSPRNDPISQLFYLP